MKLLDKLLLTLAASSVVAILMIFLTGEISSYNNSSAKANTRVVGTPQNSNDEIHVIDENIDAVLNKYFETIKKNPEQEEEISRIVELGDDDAINDDEIQIITSENLQKESSPRVTFLQHKVTEGESIWRIAQKYSIPVYTIISANPDNKRRIIQTGDLLKIPSKKGIFYKIKKGDTLSKIANRYKIDSKDIRLANDLKNSAKNMLKVGSSVFLPGAKPTPEFKYLTRRMFIWPVAGKLTSGYGMRLHPILKSRSFHTGIDIGANTGTPIRAAAAGIVVFSAYSEGSGNLVILRHKDNYYTMYAHCSSLIARRGSYVKQGETIARVGNTGMSTGSHLHFEIKKFEKRIDPISALKKIEKIKIKEDAG